MHSSEQIVFRKVQHCFQSKYKVYILHMNIASDSVKLALDSLVQLGKNPVAFTFGTSFWNFTWHLERQVETGKMADLRIQKI